MKLTSKSLISAAAKTAAALIIYFLIMNFIGLGLQLEYRIVEFVILAIGIYYGMKSIRNENPGHFTYLRGVMTGVYIGVLSCIIFAFFVFAYLMFLDPGFMKQLRETAPFGKLINPYIIATTIVAEGAAAGALFAFIAVNRLATKGEQI